MRLKAPDRSARGDRGLRRAFGPRVLPGTYTVKMTKDKNVYTTPLQVVRRSARRSTRAEDRKAQFDLAMKLYNLLGDMTLRRRADQRRAPGARRPRGEAAGERSAGASDCATRSAQVDDLRKKIVATKEGGMITGEERLREFLADLYGNVIVLRRPPLADADRCAPTPCPASSPTS